MRAVKNWIGRPEFAWQYMLPCIIVMLAVFLLITVSCGEDATPTPMSTPPTPLPAAP